MGIINYGSQIITVDFFAPADSAVVNRGFKDTRPLGIYDGGYLTRISDVSVEVSPLVCVIADGDHQIRVETQNTQLITVAIATPVIVLRWAYTGAAGNYMDMLAISAVNVQDYDIIVGVCSFAGSVLTGFSYATRTWPMVLEKFLVVEPTNPTSMRLRVKAGRLNYGHTNYEVVDQLTDVFTAPVSNSRIDLVAINSTGTLEVITGVAAVTPVIPDYAGKVVLAEVTLTAGMTTLTQTDVKDVRNMYGTATGGFTLLTDTPSSYVGQALKFTRVNSGENGIEFVVPLFSMLGDVPAFTGNGGKTLMVNPGATAIEYNFMTILRLSDTPSNYSGANNLFLKVNAAGTAVEFSGSSFLFLGDTPAVYEASKFLQVNASANAVVFTNPSITEMIDVPLFAGNSKRVLRVNAGETSAEWTNQTILESRSTDPASPEVGRIWLRTDIV